MKVLSRFIFSILAASLVWTTALYYSQNNIHNSEFLSSKYDLEMQPMGGKGSRFSRAVLSGLQLNLQKYYGHQRFILKAAHNLSALSMTFKIDRNSYLDVIYGFDADGYYGVRIGTKSFFFRSDKLGQFVKKKELPVSISEQDVHAAEIFQKPDYFALKVDNEEFVSADFGRIDSGEISFRSGLNGAIISDISYTKADGTVEDVEFFTTDGFWEVFAKNAALLAVVSAVLALFVWICRLISNIKLAMKKSLSFIVMSGVLWLSFDFFYYSRLEFSFIPSGWVSVEPLFPLIQVEEARHRFFLNWARLVDMPVKQTPEYEPTSSRKIERCESIMQTCETVATETGFKNETHTDYSILFLGGSFGKGSGANDVDQTFFRQTHRALAEKLRKKNKTIQSFNVGVILDAGSDDVEVVEKITTFNKFLNKRHYDVVVLTFLRFFPKDLPMLEQFVSELKRQQTKIIFLPQPYNPERIPPLNQLRPKPDNIGKNFLQEHEIQVLNLLGVFDSAEIRESGDIWSDFMHLTSYGQKIVADSLVPAIYSNLR